MNVSSHFLALILVGLVALPLLYLGDRSLTGGARLALRYGGVALMAGLFFGAMHYVDDQERAVGICKAMIAIVAAGCVFYEQHRVGMRRPVAERWKRFVGVILALAATSAYFTGFKFGYPKFYHRWDQYHYYMGAKYFHELGYDGLYKCTVIAQDELGTVVAPPPDMDFVYERRLDMTKEVRHPDKKIRNLGGDNLLMPVTEVLEHPEICKASFTPERWNEYKDDVRFFRMGSDKTYWEDMQKDHGYNPPPVWTVGGYFFASMNPAGKVYTLPMIGKTVWLQILAMLDVAYCIGMFAAIWWAFGWRIFAVSAIFWGCQASAPAYWTLGAFLRQDWLFWLVFSVCLARKGYPALSAASLVYSALTRIFPGLAVIGWLAVTGHQLYRHRRLTKTQTRMLLGGTLAAAVLLPLSIKVAGPTSYQDFYRHTLEVHDRTPLTNHMGLRVLISQKLPFEIPALGINTGPASGRMKYTRDEKLTDAFDVWKHMRNERYAKYRPVGWAIIALSLAYFVYVTRRIKSMWVALCLGQVFIILLSQLTCYYYVFMILLAPLTKAKRQLEVPLFGFAALTQFAYIVFGYYDDKFWVLTLLSLLACFGVLCSFLTEADRTEILRRLGRKPAPAEA